MAVKDIKKIDILTTDEILNLTAADINKRYVEHYEYFESLGIGSDIIFNFVQLANLKFEQLLIEEVKKLRIKN